MAFGDFAGFCYLWTAMLVIFPAANAVIALACGYYILQPIFPCGAPDVPVRLFAALAISKCTRKLWQKQSTKFYLNKRPPQIEAKCQGIWYISIFLKWRLYFNQAVERFYMPKFFFCKPSCLQNAVKVDQQAFQCLIDFKQCLTQCLNNV